MISKNFSNRISTSILLFLLIYLIFKFEFIFFYSLIVLGVLSLIEFTILTKKFIKMKLIYSIINIFLSIIHNLFYNNHFVLLL